MSNTARTQREHDPAILAAGGYTGWWDDRGQPAPFPDDFLDPDSDWRSTSSDIPPELADSEQPF
jgi:hypothetical protein